MVINNSSCLWGNAGKAIQGAFLDYNRIIKHSLFDGQ